MKNLKQLSLEVHKKNRGKLNVVPKVHIKNKRDMSLFYTPGVAEPCKEIARNPELIYDYTSKGHTVAVITDGSAVLGLGNIGAKASLPVMEGKCVLFKEFGNIDAVPICLETQDVDEIVMAITAISTSFGGINLEDISAPRCFEIEERLIKALDIPVMHDDQHGTAIVVLAGLINAIKIVNKKIDKVKIVICGAGAAGIAIAKLLLKYGFKNIMLVDSKGIIQKNRGDLAPYKKEIVKITNKENLKGDLKIAMRGADVFIGVSAPNIVTKEMIKSMNPDPIVFAMANPDPEIDPTYAKKAGAKIIATGRSDYPNQINNVLAFPGIFKGALEVRAKRITTEMKIAAAKALASLVKNPTPKKFIPGVFDKGVSDAVAEAVKKLAE